MREDEEDDKVAGAIDRALIATLHEGNMMNLIRDIRGRRSKSNYFSADHVNYAAFARHLRRELES